MTWHESAGCHDQNASWISWGQINCAPHEILFCADKWFVNCFYFSRETEMDGGTYEEVCYEQGRKDVFIESDSDDDRFS